MHSYGNLPRGLVTIQEPSNSSVTYLHFQNCEIRVLLELSKVCREFILGQTYGYCASIR